MKNFLNYLTIIVNIFIVLGVIFAMITYYKANTQFEKNLQQAELQFKRDSVLTVMQINLIKEQISMSNRQFINDSLIGKYEIEIYQKQINLLLKTEKLNLDSEKGKLIEISIKISELIHSYYQEKNPATQMPLNEGEERILHYVSKFEGDYNLQKAWAEELKQLLLSALNNKYLNSYPKALQKWNSMLGMASFILDFNNDFLKGDLTFASSIRFHTIFKIIEADFFDAQKELKII